MDDEGFLRELERDKYEGPPISGELWLSISTPLASLQSKKEARTAFQDTILDETNKYKYLFSGDVSVEITLQVHQQDRYESDTSPDLDNFLKPLLDALCGPVGILIDDSQIRSLGVNWISWNREDTQLEIVFRFTSTEYVQKGGLLFVQIEGPLCIPVDTSLPILQQRVLLSIIRFGFRQRQRLSKMGWDYYSSSSVLPVQRRFHRTRVNSFAVKNLDQYKRDLRLLRFRK